MKALCKKQSVLNVLLSFFMFLMLVLQFLPFWHTEDASCSIQCMVWFPDDQPQIEKHITEITGMPFNIDSVVWLTLGTFLCCILGIVYCLSKKHAVFPSVFPAIGGIMAIWNYVSRPALQLGALWPVHLLTSILLFLFGTYSLINGFIAVRQEH